MSRRRPRKALQGRRGLAVGAISLGCPKNLVDTEVMLGFLGEAGFSLVSDPGQADVLLINTCSFVQAAREESAEALAEASQWRRSLGAGALVCCGCWPQSDSARLRQEFPEIDAFMGPGDVARVASIVQHALTGAGQRKPAASPSSYLYDDRTPRVMTTAPWTAYIKIAEGCSHRCRFCVIPRLRGRYRSRSPGSVVREARALAQRGVREINLVAQDTTAYGRDRGSTDIADLLSKLARVRSLRWVRLLYGFPTRVTNRLIAAIAREPTVCEYIDVPFQHADRALLRRMGRPGDGPAYLRLIARLRSAMPDIALRSTFLVGLPGEGEEQFGRLLEFVEAAQLDRAGAFCYSPEPDTPAADMPDQVPAEVAQQRFHELMTLQQRISLARNQRWIGREIEVLIEAERESSGEWIGRSFRDAPEIDGAVKVQAGRRRLKTGEFVRVKVTAAEPYDLIAEVSGSRRDEFVGQQRACRP
ncbi:MAG: 30S ribosomal protein S12 methylthiotransferase RimO [Armatimonadota bacterium]|nr:MAG: 30S ribosomal protein S12 methylthiotransferase RimO [Armatimonadota bacterium]